MLAEQQAEQGLLRRALSNQGLILTATRNTPDALRSLIRALDIAEIATAPDKGPAAGAFELILARRTASLDAAPRVSAGWVGLGVTSGSTGRPKIVSYGHRQVIVTAVSTGERLGLNSMDISGHLMPLHLAGGIRNAFFQALLNGAAVNVLPL